MRMIFTVSHNAHSDASEQSSTFLLDDPRILVLDPASWAFLSALFLSSFTKALGEGLGQGVATSILEALGLIRRDYSDIKNYLDVLAEKVIRDVRAITLENEVRREHAKLKNAVDSFEAYLRSPQSRGADLQDLDLYVGDVYQQLSSFGPSALPGLVVAGGLLIAVRLERFRALPLNGESENVKVTICKVTVDVDKKLSGLKDAHEQRVVGPYENFTDIICHFPKEPDGGPARFERVSVSAIGCTVDGEEFTVAIEDCHGRRLTAHHVVEERCRAARNGMAADFQRIYADPVDVLKREASKILDELGRYPSRPKSDDLLQGGA